MHTERVKTFDLRRLERRARLYRKRYDSSSNDLGRIRDIRLYSGLTTMGLFVVSVFFKGYGFEWVALFVGLPSWLFLVRRTRLRQQAVLRLQRILAFSERQILKRKGEYKAPESYGAISFEKLFSESEVTKMHLENRLDFDMLAVDFEFFRRGGVFDILSEVTSRRGRLALVCHFLKSLTGQSTLSTDVRFFLKNANEGFSFWLRIWAWLGELPRNVKFEKKAPVRHENAMLVGVWIFWLVAVAAIFFYEQSLPVQGAAIGLFWLANLLALFAVGSRFSAAVSLESQFRRWKRFTLKTAEDRSVLQKYGLLEDLTDKSSINLFSKLQLQVAVLSIEGHPLVYLLLNLILPWSLTAGTLLNHIISQLEKRLPTWQKELDRLEIFLSAYFAFARGGARLPESVQDAELLMIDFYHPALPDDKRVSNSFDSQGVVVLITGSNMSGKSTFLKTLLINQLLSQAGFGVYAKKWTSPDCRIMSSLRIQDDLGDGLSYFYAEVKRLVAIKNSLSLVPSKRHFVAVDEIFRGTNNKERLEGAKKVILDWLEANGFFFVSSHDLQLAELENESKGVINYHFAESYSKGRMEFDFSLKRGPSPSTNALEIMKSEGLF